LNLHGGLLPLLASLALSVSACTLGGISAVWPLSGLETPDLPVAATYGPRQLSSRDYAYDFHHGLDLPADEGTPILAVADGIVFRAGDYPWYDNTIILVRHCPDPADESCDEADAWYALYDHLSAVLVVEGERVTQGQALGASGVSASGYPHLHFEIRAGGYQESDAVHPLRYLPYTNGADTDISVDSLSRDGAGGATVAATITLPSDAPDLVSVTAWLLRCEGGVEREISSQTVDLEAWNRAYDDAPDGAIDEPEHEDITLDPAVFNSESSAYALGVTFAGLSDDGGSADGLRVEIDAVDASDRRADAEVDASAL